MRYDVSFINPMGNHGTHYAVECNTIEEAKELSPIMLSASSQWKPEDFTITDVKVSIYEEYKEEN